VSQFSIKIFFVDKSKTGKLPSAMTMSQSEASEVFTCLANVFRLLLLIESIADKARQKVFDYGN
jgi:hypothetical protein